MAGRVRGPGSEGCWSLPPGRFRGEAEGARRPSHQNPDQPVLAVDRSGCGIARGPVAGVVHVVAETAVHGDDPVRRACPRDQVQRLAAAGDPAVELHSPGRGRKRRQRRLGARAPAEHDVPGAERRRVRLLPPLPGRRGDRRCTRPERVPLRHRMGSYPARAGLGLDGSPRPLLARGRLLPRPWRNPGCHAAPLHEPAMAGARWRLAIARHARALFGVREPCDTAPRRPRWSGCARSTGPTRPCSWRQTAS
jgi:hypothetical protein